MEFVWSEWAWATGSVDELEPGPDDTEAFQFMKSWNRLRLMPEEKQHRVKFNKNDPAGFWHYDDATKMLFIEFHATYYVSAPNRRHAFRERDDGSFQLLGPAPQIYHDRVPVWTKNSIVHKNWNDIVLQKIQPPVPEMCSD